VRYAVDISNDMINATKKTVGKSRKIHYDIKDIENLEYKENIDIVIASGVIEYLKEDKLAIQNLHKALKKGGVAIITIQNQISLPRLFVELLALLPQPIKRKLFTLDQHRRHSPLKLDSMLKEAGFKKVCYSYFHFYPFFIPFDRLFKRAYVYLGLKMERFRQTSLGTLLATGYIVKVKRL